MKKTEKDEKKQKNKGKIENMKMPHSGRLPRFALRLRLRVLDVGVDCAARRAGRLGRRDDEVDRLAA